MENNLLAPKCRGRPLGSKNKRKEPEKPSEVMRQDAVGVQLKVLEITAESDVIDAVKNFARSYKLDVSVISCQGLVRSPTIYHPKPLPQNSSTFNYQGVFNLLSLKGNFYGSRSSGTCPSSFSGRYYICFANHEGNVMGRFVTSRLIAASKISLVVTIMRETDCIKLPPTPTPPRPSGFHEANPLVSARQVEVCSSARGSMTAYGVPYPTPVRMCNRIANGYLCLCAIK